MVTLDLINYLKQSIPNRHPKLTESDREIWFNAGQYSVVEMLERLYEEGQDDIMSKKTITGGKYGPMG